MSTAFVHLTDLHVGKHGHAYNLDVARERIEAIPELVADEAGASSITEWVFGLGGDNVDGTEVYPGQAHRSPHPTVAQVGVAGEAIFQAALNAYEINRAPVRIVGVIGNHGKMGKESHAQSNLDAHLIYDLALRAHHSELDWLNVRNSCNTNELVKVEQTRGLLTHQLAKHAGTPAMQIKILATLVEHGADWAACGHFHVPTHSMVEGRDVFFGGSLSGRDDMNDKIRRYSPATQTFWLVTADQCHGFTVLRW